MERFILEILNDGFSPEQANAVRGGSAISRCTCNNGAKYDCGCFSKCHCHGTGSELVCSENQLTPPTEV